MAKTPQDYLTLWLQNPEVSREFKQQLQSMNPTQLASVFSEQPMQFGTAGVRKTVGVGHQHFNVFVYRLLAYAYGQFILKTTNQSQPIVVIVHDNRARGDEFAVACAQVLAHMHIKVLLAPNNALLATPIISYLIRAYQADGGINITASHNPKHYNGFKAYNRYGMQLNNQQANFVVAHIPDYARIFAIPLAPCSHYLIQNLEPTAIANYFTTLIQYLPNTKPAKIKTIKVLYSPHHGVCAHNMAQMAHQLGYINFTQLPSESNVTSDFSDAKICNPEDPQSFESAAKYAQQLNYDYLMASDPDGDRFGFAERQDDGSFYYFNGNENGILFIHYLLTFKKSLLKNYVVSSYVTNNFIDRLLKPHGIKVLRTGTGFKWICQHVELQQQLGWDLLLGFEEAIGALIFPFNREKDSYQSVALALEMINYYRHQKIKLTTVLKQLYDQYGYWYGTTDSFIIAGSDWQTLMHKKLGLLKQYPHSQIDRFTIVKVQWNPINDCLDWILCDDNWIRFRLSGTEPKFKIYYNLYGTSEQDVKSAFNAVRQTLIDYLGL